MLLIVNISAWLFYLGIIPTQTSARAYVWAWPSSTLYSLIWQAPSSGNAAAISCSYALRLSCLVAYGRVALGITVLLLVSQRLQFILSYRSSLV